MADGTEREWDELSLHSQEAKRILAQRRNATSSTTSNATTERGMELKIAW
jgi:hypothetical protein